MVKSRALLGAMFDPDLPRRPIETRFDDAIDPQVAKAPPSLEAEIASPWRTTRIWFASAIVQVVFAPSTPIVSSVPSDARRTTIGVSNFPVSNESEKSAKVASVRKALAPFPSVRPDDGSVLSAP